MKVLGIGDTHGDTSSICNIAIPIAKKNGCEIIVQEGDFGYHEHAHDGVRFLNKVSKCLVRDGITMYWLDGNHENHPLLWEKYGPSGPFGFYEIRPNLWYMPRGSVFKLGHVTCLALGGAFSIDKHWRLMKELERRGHRVGMYSSYGVTDMMDSSVKEWAKNVEGHTYWWPTEMITHEQAKLAKKNAAEQGPIDIMFTHDVPDGIDVPGIHSQEKWKYPETWQNRGLLREVFDVAQPKLLVHGHYHVRYTGKLPLKPNEAKLEGGLLEWDYCRVDGLSYNGKEGFAVVLDLDELFPVQ